MINDGDDLSDADLQNDDELSDNDLSDNNLSDEDLYDLILGGGNPISDNLSMAS